MSANRSKNFNWLRALVTAVVMGALILGIGLPVFAPLGIDAFLSWASVIIVLYAIWISVQALNLAKATQRPFLTVVREPEEPKIIVDAGNPRVILHIQNTGNLPADRVSILCGLRTSAHKEVVVKLKHSPSDLEPSIYFPGVNVDHTYYMCKEKSNELFEGEYSVVIDIKYDNKVARKKCSTVRTFDYEKLLPRKPSERTVIRHQSPKNTAHKDDSWD